MIAYEIIQKIANRIKKLVSDVAPFPCNESYIWRDNKISILSAFLLWIIAFFRWFSLLQWIKFFYRKHACKCNYGSRDFGSNRKNIPPYIVEIYFIIWLVVQEIFYIISYFHIFSINNMIIHGINCYFIFESMVWVIYYTVLRRFYDEIYRINHILENFVILLVIIPTQALSFSNTYTIPVYCALFGILGIKTLSNSVFINLLGLLYQSIVIVLIISAFPYELIVKKNRRNSIYSRRRHRR